MREAETSGFSLEGKSQEASGNYSCLFPGAVTISIVFDSIYSFSFFPYIGLILLDADLNGIIPQILYVNTQIPPKPLIMDAASIPISLLKEKSAGEW